MSTCGDCKHWRENAHNPRTGNCVRFPPQVVALRSAANSSVDFHTVYPTVLARGEACGEFTETNQ